jgi:hypothetical protein
MDQILRNLVLVCRERPWHIWISIYKQTCIFICICICMYDMHAYIYIYTYRWLKYAHGSIIWYTDRILSPPSVMNSIALSLRNWAFRIGTNGFQVEPMRVKRMTQVHHLASCHQPYLLILANGPSPFFSHLGQYLISIQFGTKKRTRLFETDFDIYRGQNPTCDEWRSILPHSPLNRPNILL